MSTELPLRISEHAISSFKTWMVSFFNDDFDRKSEDEIIEYLSEQLTYNFDSFNQMLTDISLDEVSRLPCEHFAYLLIAISDLATIDNSQKLGASVQRFLESTDRYIIDAAHRAVSASRLNYAPAATLMLLAAENTDYVFLKSSLIKEAKKLQGTN